MIEDKDNLSAAEEVNLDGLKIHQMPKKYKSGSFDYSEYSEKVLHHKKPMMPAVSNSNPAPVTGHKKSGLVIVVVGILLLGILVYGAYWYYKNGKGLSLFGQKTEIPATPSITHQDQVIDQGTFIPTSTEPIVSTSSDDGLIPNTSVASSSALDSDADGLNDVEETLLGTDPQKSDTDGDTYNDLTELLNMYNPAGNGNIYSMAAIKKHQDNTNKYSVAYPKEFVVEAVDNGASTIFKATDESFIQVIVQDNEDKESISDWYNREFGVNPINDQLFTMGTFSGVRSSDNLTAYFVNSTKTKLYIISYTPQEPASPVYAHIMDMILKSFTVIK